MAIDYRALVTSLAELTSTAGPLPELASMDALVRAVSEATGAAGGTFTEYGDGGGRVVVAHGVVAWALGRPAAAELVRPDVVEEPYVGRVESMPADAAGPLRARGVVVVAGHPVRVQGRAVGGLHLYFGPGDVAGRGDTVGPGDNAGPGDSAAEPPAAEPPAAEPPAGEPPTAEPDWPAVTTVLQAAAAFAAGIYTGREAMPVRSAHEEDDRSLFLAAAGHELRTPVTAIKGHARLLADRWDSLDDDQRRASARVLAQRADELARLVDRLLDTSVGDPRVGALVRTVPFDPLAALVQAAGALPIELRRSIRVALPNWLPPAQGDPDVMGTVVAELVTNAVRASRGMGTKSSSVDITAGADADTVYIRVLDRGIGISPAEAERAFERFWRSPRQPPVVDRDTDSGNGVGLGLYLVRRLVERQNGWVSLRPRDGGGTVAEVRLARADAPPRPANPQA
jgi:two-component system phosphate regulon sensor histidine kinase PhoR